MIHGCRHLIKSFTSRSWCSQRDYFSNLCGREIFGFPLHYDFFCFYNTWVYPAFCPSDQWEYCCVWLLSKNNNKRVTTDQLLLEKTTKEKHSTLPAFKRASLCKVFCEMLAINWVRHHSGLVRRTGPLDRRQFSDISADLGFQGGR